ncbi:MAG: NADH:ubiquinone oxidoreductase [Candidatus Bathyarchaeia archaeon]
MRKKKWGIRLLHINVGSCNGCDVEVLSLAIFGYEFVDDSPDVIVICGSVNNQTKPVLKQLLDRNRRVPKVAVGTCAISARVFNCENVEPVDDFTDVDMYVFGCPPSPIEIRNGIEKVVRGSYTWLKFS